MHLKAIGARTNIANTSTAQQTFTALPTGTTVDLGPVYINPASANANETLFGVALAGAERLRLDDGGDLAVANSVSISGGNLSLTTTGGFGYLQNRFASGMYIGRAGGAPGHVRVFMGYGALSQETLSAHLDQDGLTVRRDVDGDAGTYNEAGSVLTLQRDVTNVGTEAGNFLENQNAGGTVLSRFDKDGELVLGETVRIYGSGGILFVRNVADSAYKDVGCLYLTGYSGVLSNLMRSRTDTADFQIYHRDQDSDAAVNALRIRGAAAYASAATNKVGGLLDIYAGSGDGAGGQTAAHGGDLQLHGGAAASDLASSNGGDVIIYGGANGSSGNDGSVKLGDSAETNYVGVATDGTLTLYGTARKTQHIVISNADLGKGATGATQVIVGKYVVWEFGLNDDAVTDWEVPPDWASGTDIVVSVHWQVNEAYAADSGEVQWEVTWAATPHTATEALDGPTHTGTLDSGDQNIPATARHLTATDVGTISGASLSVEDALGLTLKRVALDGGNDPTAEPGVVHIEMAYTVDSFGA